MIKAVIFDWGQVFTKDNLIKVFVKKIKSSTKYSEDELLKLFYRLEPFYELGIVHPADFWKHFREHCSASLTAKELSNKFCESTKPLKSMLNFVQDLKTRTKTILLTNSYEDVFGYIVKKYKLENYFDHLYASCTIHAKKPSSTAFKYVLRDIKLRPKECLFVDNKLNNIYAAKNLGFQVLQFDLRKSSVAVIKKDIAELMNSLK